MRNFLGLLGRIWEILARRVDNFLMASALAIVGVGLVTLFSASDQNMARVTSQAASLGFALVLMWIVANVAPQQLVRAAVPLYALSVLLLVAVALGGTMVNGSRRWLNLGIGRFQPSELMKIALPLMLAWYFQKREAKLAFGDFIVAAVLIALPVWLIKREPDLGTALISTITSRNAFLPSSILRATRWARATIARRRRSRSAPAASSARAGSMARRRISISCRSGTPTSSSRCSERSSG